MEDKLKQQIEQLLERAEKSKEVRVVEFFERAAEIALPAQEDRYWLLEQFNTLVEAANVEEDKQTRNVLIMTTLFTMGRVWERYYTKQVKKGKGVKPMLRQIGRLLWAIITLPYGVFKVDRIVTHAIHRMRKN